jgi:hypothetical protein
VFAARSVERKKLAFGQAILHKDGTQGKKKAVDLNRPMAKNCG